MIHNLNFKTVLYINTRTFEWMMHTDSDKDLSTDEYKTLPRC